MFTTLLVILSLSNSIEIKESNLAYVEHSKSVEKLI